MKVPKWIINLAVKILVKGETMEKIKAMLAGKKTYLSAAGLIIAALVQYSSDGNMGALINKIIEAIALCSVRSAIG